MTETNDFIIERAIASRAAQGIIAATWLSDEHTLAEWDADIAAINALKEKVADTEATKTGDAGTLDEKLNVLHNRTVMGLGLFKVKHRNNPAMTHGLKALTAAGGSRGAIVDEALDFESNWEKWDPTWSPKPAETLASFKTLRQLCLTLKETYASSKGEWRVAVGEYNAQSQTLNGLCKAWYEAATTVFPEGTAEGDMIRNTVPTTTDFISWPSQAEITLDETGAGRYALTLDALHATKFDVFQRLVGAPEFLLVGEDVAPGVFEKTGVAAGNYEVKAMGKNSRGSGPESEVMGLTVS